MKIKLSLTLTFLLFWSAPMLASDPVVEKEGEFYGTTLREKELEDQLLESSLYKDCKDKNKDVALATRAAEINKCVGLALDKASDTDIKSLSEKVDLTSINEEQTKTTKGIREYLSERVARAIYGKDYDPLKTLQKTKYVDQTVFFDLYAEQLGKNVLLEVSNYCLENIRYLDSNKNVLSETTTPPGCSVSTVTKNDGKKYATIKDECLKNIVEVNYPVNKKEGDDTFNSQVEAALVSVEKLKEASHKEIKTGNAAYFEKKSNFCAIVVNSMCTRYKCSQPNNLMPAEDCTPSGNNSSSTTKTPKDIFGEAKNYGAKACVVLDRIRKYKTTITQVEKAKEDLLKTGGGKKGFDSSFFEKVYSGTYERGAGSNEESLSEIATISSREITENEDIDELYGLKEEAKELRQKCKNESDIESSEECKKLIDLDLEEKQVALETSFRTETEVRIKELKALKDNEAIKDYLTKIGLGNLYKDGLKTEELKDLITTHYTSERNALIEEMKNKLKTKLAEKDAQGNVKKDQLEAAVSNTITDLENQKDRLATTLHYNNIVTSFLTTQSADGKEESKNTIGLQNEMQGYQDYQVKGDSDDYFNNVTEGEDLGKASDAEGLKYMDYIDQVLGNSQPN